MTVETHHKTVSLDDLIVDPRVQRVEGLDQVRVRKMAESFNPLALGTITVSQRKNGSLVILDGMHRVAAARQAEHKAFMSAEVITGLTVQQEAELFLLLNAAKMPSAITKFLARVVMDEPAAVAMNTIVESHGWRVAPVDSNGCLIAVTAMERVYKRGAQADAEPGAVLDRTMEVVTAAWGHDRQAVNQHIIEAVGQLIDRFGPMVDTKKLVAEMQDTRPGILIGRAKNVRDFQGGTVPAAMAKILAGMHNKKRRTNLLPEWVWIR